MISEPLTYNLNPPVTVPYDSKFYPVFISPDDRSVLVLRVDDRVGVYELEDGAYTLRGNVQLGVPHADH